MDRSPDETPEQMQENAVAAALGVQPEVIAVPPGIRHGIMLFELENGEFGFIPMNEGTTLMVAESLCHRISLGIQAEIIANKVMEKQRTLAVNVRQAQAEQEKKPKLMLPRFGVNK